MYGKRLREIRVDAKMTQAEFAKQFDIAPSTISAYEIEAHEPPIDFLRQVAEKYNVSTDYLLGNVNTKTDYREMISDEFDDFADYISMGYTVDEAEKMLSDAIQKYGKMIMRLHYDDRRKVELYVKDLREQGEY